MAHDVDNRELVANVHDALKALLDKTGPEHGVSLRSAYWELGRALKNNRSENEYDPDELYAAMCARRSELRRMPREQRENLLLQTLGDGRRTVRELMEGLNSVLGEFTVYETNVRSLAMYGLVRTVRPRRGDLPEQAAIPVLPAISSSRSHLGYRAGVPRQLIRDGLLRGCACS